MNVVMKLDASRMIEQLTSIAAQQRAYADAATNYALSRIRETTLDKIDEQHINAFTGALRSRTEIQQDPTDPTAQDLTVNVPYGAAIERGRRAVGIPMDVVLDNKAGLTAWVRIVMKPKIPKFSAIVLTGQATGGIRGRGHLASGSNARLKTKRVRIRRSKDLVIGFYQRVARAIAFKKRSTPTPARPFFQPAIDSTGGIDSLRNEFFTQFQDLIAKTQ